MGAYKVKLVSQTNAIVLIIVLLATTFASVSIFIPRGIRNEKVAILVVLLGMTIAYFLWQTFVTGRSEWNVDNNQITIVWTKKFPFSDSKDFNWKWNEIEKISKGIDPQYYNLKIKLTSGQIITFYHDYLTWKDDFDDLILLLYQTFNSKKKLQPT